MSYSLIGQLDFGRSQNPVPSLPPLHVSLLWEHSVSKLYFSQLTFQNPDGGVRVHPQNRKSRFLNESRTYPDPSVIPCNRQVPGDTCIVVGNSTPDFVRSLGRWPSSSPTMSTSSTFTQIFSLRPRTCSWSRIRTSFWAVQVESPKS